MANQKYLSIDFETGSCADLRKVGAACYAADPTTRIICVAYNQPWIDGKQDEIKCVYIPPGENWSPEPGLKNWVSRILPVRAWNASFEYHIWNQKVSGTKLVPEQLHDTMAQAAYWGLPLSLDMAGQALPELGIVKDKVGHAQMLRMSRPRRVNRDGSVDSWWDVDEPTRRDALMDYCKQDVRVEQAIGDYLPPIPPRERKIWLMDFKANARGIPLDKRLAGRMKELAEKEQARLHRELADVTGNVVRRTTLPGPLAAWCVLQGLDNAKDGLAKDRLPKLIEEADNRGLFKVSEALSIRREAAKSSVAKLDAMDNWAGRYDDRMRGLTQYYGAFRTGRWAGRGPQVQNFPRPEVKNVEALISTILGDAYWNLDNDTSMLFFGTSLLSALSSALRGCLYVPEHLGEFASLDFSQIEARVLAWLAGSEKILDAYRDGRDLYKVAASDIYRVSEDQVDGDQRQVGKVSVLALGYGGGVGAFQTMAKVYGLHIPDEKAEEIKSAWREKNPEIVSYWSYLERAAKEALASPGKIITVARNDVHVMFSMWRGHLLCKLPSGRTLCYREAKVIEKFMPWGDKAKVVSYMGVDQYTRKWRRIDTYGGKLAENITQAVARDVMAEGLIALDNTPGIHVLGSVHDEALLEIEKDFGVTLDELGLIMSGAAVSRWAKGLPVEADGYIGQRFGK